MSKDTRVTIFMNFEQMKELKKAAIDVELTLSDYLVGCGAIIRGGIALNPEITEKISKQMAAAKNKK